MALDDNPCSRDGPAWTDNLTPEAHSAMMSRIRGKDTAPEPAVRRILCALGYWYRLHAKAKLRALAAFADQFGDRFLRIQSIAKVEDGKLRALDLLEADVRKAVREFEGGKVSALYVSEYSALYA